jgi:hypothetical protein
MAILVDPDQALKDKKTRPAASQIISWLLYPVVFLIGVTIGIAVGVKEAPNFQAEKNKNRNFSNARIVTNVVTNGNRNSNGNTNSATNGSILNTNIFRSGDAAKLDATTEAKLQADKQSELNRLVDKTADFVDILRQQDLIDLRYTLRVYFAVRGEYPSTDNRPIRLERGTDDTFYTAMKDFYGGSFYEKIDPQSPQYYYGYTSDGQSYQLSAYLTSKKKAFYLSSDDTN